MLLALGSAALGAVRELTLQVKVPASTPGDAKIYISGSSDALGNWDGKGLELTRSESGRFTVKLKLEENEPIEFKFTRGSWETVEKNLDGSEKANRTVTPTRDETVELTVEAWADQVSGAPATNSKLTRTGDIRLHPIHSKLLNNDRKLWVWLPPDYEKNATARYPVFYMHDGQNLFDASTGFAGEWNVDETAQRLISEKKIRPIIIVGIENTKDRMAEYTPGERGTLYQRFVVEEVKPFIDSTYRTSGERAETAIGGSSLGGLISLYIAEKYPQTFGMCCAMSPSLWWNNQAAMTDLAKDAAWMKKTKFWIDTGTAEGTAFQKQVDLIKKLGELLASNGLEAEHDFRLKIVDGAKHNEAAWSQRFDQVLIFFFSP
ncbi:MAG TPA: alpha/beta hydrolase-fold protein [Tepidisphaeraceae bacterium]